MPSVRHSIKLLTLTLTGLLSLNTGIASAEPIWTQNGDYRTNVRTPVYTSWEVVDPDPNGLNCRMALQYRPARLGTHEMDPTPISDNRHNISTWPALLKLSTGTRLNAVSYGRGGEFQKIILDENGRPWLALNTYLGTCLVRAKSQYIQPIPASRKHFPY